MPRHVHSAGPALGSLHWTAARPGRSASPARNDHAPARKSIMVKKIVLASNNPGKLAELQAMFAPLGIDLVRQSDLGIAEAEEPHRTFVENALAKARHAARESGLPALADDAGLCVD